MKEIGIWEHVSGGSEKPGRDTFLLWGKKKNERSYPQSKVGYLPAEWVFAMQSAYI